MYGRGFEAAERVSFDLTYKRSPDKRGIEPGVIKGAPTDDSYKEGAESPGGWNNFDFANWPENEDDVQGWLYHYFTLAMQEAIHEGLEWFRVDGKIFLNPHDDRFQDLDDAVIDLSNEFIEKLYNLAMERKSK